MRVRQSVTLLNRRSSSLTYKQLQSSRNFAVAINIRHVYTAYDCYIHITVHSV